MALQPVHIHGYVHAPGQFLSGGLPMYTVTVTGADFTVLVGEEEKHNVALDTIINLIGTRAQTVVLGTVEATTFRFAVEHNEVFGDLTVFSAYVQDGLRVALDDATITVVIADFAF